MVKVCDAIMGSGKSSAAINYMNANPEKKFIYIAPYLDEARRIREACPALDFVEPSSAIPKYGFRKYKHTLKLIQDGRNIASTHSMFLRYTGEMTEALRKNEYTLIIDEDIEVLEVFDCLRAGDVRILSEAGYIQKEGEHVVFCAPADYDGVFKQMFDLARTGELVDISDCLEGGGKDTTLCYWVYPERILSAFRDVYILTYMFDAQTIRRYLDLKGFEYTYIHTSFDGKTYSFTDGDAYVPEYVAHIRDKIHVVDDEKLNEIGEGRYSLSASWYARLTSECDNAEQLRRNVARFFRYVAPVSRGNIRMWSSFETGKKHLSGKGYSRSFTSFNMKATNEYRSRFLLAYCVNVFMNPFEKRYLTKRGVDVNEDGYALSVMVQWIWRSAIRDGGEIWVYIPSRRMRELLISWMDSLEKGGAADENV